MNDTGQQRNATRLQRGFSLVELMVSVAILTIVIGVLTDGIIQIQKKSASDVNKVGVAQESRQFMDQILRDLRQAGYPSQGIFDATTLTSYASSVASTCDTPTTVRCCTLDTNVACGLTNFSSSSIQFEGDIDGSGVSEVYIQVIVPQSGNCPCTLQRGTESKQSFMNGNPPAYYTELDGLMSQNVFTAYEFDGTAFNSSTDQFSSIKNIGVTLYVRSPQPDTTETSSTYPTTTMVSEARINN
ncbi:MAG TPA: prepilin-type N-terminal cleavage/methylation domain-containing protein [Candidatus Acidoferrales bacterium]|jgi:prepilin-type N-terminal cleavage/methylation domain-containing protein|nr:prepilin-type N-terminal cleavage/methylation domain-containing protein [Candidatus Acidoferrales bacterium]